MNRRPRWLATVFAAAAASLLPVAAAQAADTPAQQLVHKYAPIVNLRAQEHPPCDTAEEQFKPTTVDVMLGNPRVKLVPPAKPGKTPAITTAPTAADIAGLGQGYHLDVPGDPLDAGCTYGRDFAALDAAGKAPAVTYAHIATEKGVRGLAVQYWFFYYFNQFNDLHEGDWEGMQIVFDANTPRQALAKGPYQVGLFQHAGGEKADWSDDKVEKEGTHPVVYPAAGSHATFYDSAIYVENGQGGSGLGCDNTTQPLHQVRPTPELMPTNPRPGSRFQWLTYDGHWGQKEKGYNNGPTGPTTKSQWLEPITWMEGIRSTSPQLPAGTVAGPQITSAFCGAVATVSDFVNLEARTQFGAYLMALILIALVVVPAALTRWRPVDITRLRQRRAFGQLIRAARQLYGRHWRALIPIGLTAIPIVGVLGGVQWLVAKFGPGNAVDTSGGLSGLHSGLSDAIGAIGHPIGYAVVGAAGISCVLLIDQGRHAGFLASYKEMLRRFWRLVGGQLLASLMVLALAVTIIGLPIAVWKFVGWQFVQQEILFKDAPLRDAFRGSSRLVRGHWWETVRVAGFLWLISVVTGPVLGFALIFANFSLLWINILGSLVFALLVPYVAVGRTLLYFDLQVRHEEALVAPKRRRRWWPRPRPTTQPG